MDLKSHELKGFYVLFARVDAILRRSNDLPRRCYSLGKSKKNSAKSDTDFDTRDRLKIHSRAILCELTH
jgi:hypothetical protein